MSYVTVHDGSEKKKLMENLAIVYHELNSIVLKTNVLHARETQRKVIKWYYVFTFCGDRHDCLDMNSNPLVFEQWTTIAFNRTGKHTRLYAQNNKGHLSGSYGRETKRS